MNFNDVDERQRAFIFLELTKELIRNSNEMLMLQTTLDRESEEIEDEREKARKITILPEARRNIFPRQQRPTRISPPVPNSGFQQPDWRVQQEPQQKIQNPEALQPSIFSGKENQVSDIMVSFENKPVETEIKKPMPKRKIIRPPVGARVLRIPAPKLPKGFEHLQPTPVRGEAIDLGKLNPYLQDPKVMSIETNGPDDKVTVDGPMGKKPTNVTLSKEEIDGVVEKFSTATKIPATEGIYRVVFGNLMFLAIISEIIGSKFVIRKIRNQQPQVIQQQPRRRF